jgi:hypothetical protein
MPNRPYIYMRLRTLKLRLGHQMTSFLFFIERPLTFGAHDRD